MVSNGSRFIFRFWFTTLVLLSVVLYINYFVDCAGAFNVTQYEKKLVTHSQLYGSAIQKNRNYNERVFRLELINSLNRNPDTIIVGASTVRYIGQDTYFKNSLNLAIGDGSLEEQSALLYLSLKKITPKRIIWGIDPYLLTNQKRRLFVREPDELALQIKRMEDESPIEFDYQYKNGIDGLLNLAYLKENLKSLFEDNSFEECKFDKSTPPKFGNEKYGCVYMDGSSPTNFSFPTLNKDSIERVPLYRGINDGMFISKSKINFLFKILNDLNTKDIEIYLYKPPMYNDSFMKISKFKWFNDLELALSAKNNYLYKIIGGYDAAFFACNELDFDDQIHARPACINRALKSTADF
jgi:hypothetical protein